MRLAVVALLLCMAMLLGVRVLGEGRQRVDLIVRADCLIKPLHFEDCDLSNPDMDKCKKMEPPEFRHSCSEIRIVHER